MLITPARPLGTLSKSNENLGFDVDTVVSIGASITENSYELQVVRTLCEDIAFLLYNKTLSVEERATSGQDTAAQATAISGILTEYTGQSNVVFMNHMGGNDVSGFQPTQYLNLTALQQQDLIDDYTTVIDAVEGDGHRFIVTGLTFRDYGDATLDADPAAAKSNELGGSYTYVRDWLQPLATSKGTGFVSQYEYTRSMYDIFLSADNVHATPLGEVLTAVHQFTNVMELSEGRTPLSVDEVNFNNSFAAPDTTIDIVCAVGASATPNNANVNWIAVPYGNGAKQAYATDLVQTDGSSTNISVLISGADKAFNTNLGAPTDTTASLTNSELLAGQITKVASNADIAFVIYGLEANRLYDVDLVHSNETTYTAHINTATATSPDSGNNNILSISTRSDPLGRVIGLIENTSSVGISGLRIRSGSASSPYSTTVSFGASAVTGANINNATAENGTLNDLIDTDGNTLTGHSVTWTSSGSNGSGIGSPGDTSSDLTNDTALSSSMFVSGGDVTNTTTFSGFPANHSVTVKFAASRPAAGGRTQDVSVNGATAVSYDVNDDPVTVLQAVTTTDGSGNITVAITETNSANYSYISAIQIDVT